jgi:hypothetical protein
MMPPIQLLARICEFANMLAPSHHPEGQYQRYLLDHRPCHSNIGDNDQMLDQRIYSATPAIRQQTTHHYGSSKKFGPMELEACLMHPHH